MAVNIVETDLPGVKLIQPTVYKDSRGYFMEIHRKDAVPIKEINDGFVQDNLSSSLQGVIRGLHYQHPSGQGKLVQVLQGEVFDVAVDLRIGSPTFKKWIGITLSAANHHQLYIPEGFAHGFAVMSPFALFFYKCSEYYAPECERGINFADPELAIDWPVQTPLVSDKDAGLPLLKEIPKEHLPQFKGP